MDSSEQRYHTPRALLDAVKARARNSGQDVGRSLSDFFHYRFLERVFSEENPQFVLKGARGMLARRIDSRRTLDTDLFYRGADIDKASEEIARIGMIDLNDFLIFRISGSEPIVKEQSYRDGTQIKLTPVMGGIEQRERVSVDLVVDSVFSGEPDHVTPAGRLSIPDLPVFDYLVQPVANAMTEKVCAIMETHGKDRPSSRVKDLADLASYITSQPFSANEFRQELLLECRLRKLTPIKAFTTPSAWGSSGFRASYRKSAKEAHLSTEYEDLAETERAVKECIDVALSGSVDGKTWDPNLLQWH